MLVVSGYCMSVTFMYSQNCISVAICDNKVGFPKYTIVYYDASICCNFGDDYCRQIK